MSGAKKRARGDEESLKSDLAIAYNQCLNAGALQTNMVEALQLWSSEMRKIYPDTESFHTVGDEATGYTAAKWESMRIGSKECHDYNETRDSWSVRVNFTATPETVDTAYGVALLIFSFMSTYSYAVTRPSPPAIVQNVTKVMSDQSCSVQVRIAVTSDFLRKNMPGGVSEDMLVCLPGETFCVSANCEEIFNAHPK